MVNKVLTKDMFGPVPVATNMHTQRLDKNWILKANPGVRQQLELEKIRERAKLERTQKLQQWKFESLAKKHKIPWPK